jgi:pyrroloquinoline quinone (PQQ) biosynthesis protein C
MADLEKALGVGKMTQFLNPAKPRPVVAVNSGFDVGDRFLTAIKEIAEDHDPTRSPFFRRLRDLPAAIARDPNLLGQIHLVYQAAMHATRAAVYYLPHLDSPSMRKRKLQIFIDDDGLAGGDTHHYQLTRVFKNIGARLLLDDEDFGEAKELCRHLDADTARFVQLATTLYSRSLGAWCVVEVISDSWMRSLADSLAAHFPGVPDEPYFADCFSQGVEERHAEESLEVTATVLRERPELYSETVLDAKLMAEALDGVWRRLDAIIRTAEQRSQTGTATQFNRTMRREREPVHGAV